MALSDKAGEAVYSGTFIAYWIESILYYQAPEWVLILGYTLFGGHDATNWFWVRPRQFDLWATPLASLARRLARLGGHLPDGRLPASKSRL